jgi:hypothetical protein
LLPHTSTGSLLLLLLLPLHLEQLVGLLVRLLLTLWKRGIFKPRRQCLMQRHAQ